MNYLITGSKGFIGRNLISYMKEKSIPYCIYEEWNKHAKDIDVIIHLSADTDVRKSIKEPIKNFKKNTKKTFDMLHYTMDLHIPKIIFVSSMGVVDPRSPYLASKLSGEAYCTAFRNSYHLNTHIARLSNVYGPCSEFKDSIISKFIKVAIKNKTFYIYGNGTQTRDFIYVKDVVKSLLNTRGKISYISSGNTISINSLILKLVDLSIELLGRAPRIQNKQLNGGEIDIVKSTLGISNPTNIDKGLRKTFKWFVKHL